MRHEGSLARRPSSHNFVVNARLRQPTRTMDDNGDHDDSSASSYSSPRDLFLSPDERYAVWLVKRAERPELLERNGEGEHDDKSASCTASCSDSNEIDQADEGQEEDHFVYNDISHGDDEGDDDESIDPQAPPLTDGCDLVHWRKHQFATLPEHSLALAAQQVGYGCTLLRRESQLPLPTAVSSNIFSCWHKLRQRLLEPPQSTAVTIDVNDIDSNSQHPCWFECDNVPAILLGCTRDWQAMESCQWSRLVHDFGHLEWRFSDTHAETMTLTTYEKYTQWEGLLDDAPLAVYDSQLHVDERARLLDDYVVPKCFHEDLFDLLPDDQRPPYRWTLMGPARSGTGLHIDPAGTHAWVTLVEGCKRWVLFPYGTDPAMIHMQDPAIPSAIWFRDYYDKIMPYHPHAIEILQRPGETVYVPAGWPHLVLNLERSVAITHNYASAQPSMERLWHALSAAEPEMAQIFYSRLEEHRPDLAEAIRST
jgi:histone arginine demethylase JMJD6